MRYFAILPLLIVGAVCAQQTPDFLDVRETGASGSKFNTTASIAAGSKAITVADPGDFKAGQGVMLSRANIRFSNPVLWGPKAKYAASKPADDLVQLRGYDGSLGSWTIYIIDIDGKDPATFRWSDDFCRTWKGTKVKITGDWQPLSGGTEIKLGNLDWDSGYVVTFSARDQLQSVIEKVEGKTVTLRDAPTREANDAVLRHNDTEALQAAIDKGIAEKRNVYFPPGTYCIARGLKVNKAAGLTLEGANGVDTVLDISEGEGACFELRDGTEVNIRNFRMIGNTGFDARDQAGYLPCQGAGGVWGFYLKPTHGMMVSNTERVLLENCHASKMSGECFYSGGRSRAWNQPEPTQYTKAITYLRCSVTDSARNAFNNNDMAENTSVLYCRVVDVGGCTWEGASRFVRFIGNYVRNAGTVAMGNIRSRDERYEQLGSGQHIIADNVFEGNICYGGAAIRAAAGASQVIVRNNLFINFNSSGVDISGRNSNRDLTAEISDISGNIFDMTDVTNNAKARTAVLVTGSHVSIEDNQIYVRGAVDPQVTAIHLWEPAVNLNVHDNLLRNCGAGLKVERASSQITEVVSPTTFVATGRIPLERRQSHRYQGWNIAWWRGGKAMGRAVIAEFDPVAVQFKLKAPAALKVGDTIEVFPPSGNNWDLHHNTIANCLAPVSLDLYGSPTTIFRSNIITAGDAATKEAVTVSGRVNLLDNTFSGFTAKDQPALALYPDRFGKPLANLCEGNVFDNCLLPVSENVAGLWDAYRGGGNVFVSCGSQPKPLAAPVQNIKPVLRTVEVAVGGKLTAPKLTKPITLDGKVSEWPWTDKQRVTVLQQSPSGGPGAGPKSQMLAAYDDNYVYVALRVSLPANYKLNTSGGSYASDGMELAFASGDPKVPSATFVMWGGAGGTFTLVPVGGADGKQADVLNKQVKYAAAAGKDEWTAEWRLPLAVLGPQSKTVKKLLFNVGIRYAAIDYWSAWVGTGAELFRVESAGQLIMQ